MMQLLPSFDWTEVATRTKVDARFDAVDARFNAVDARFNAVDARFDAVDARFDAVDARFEKQEARFERIEGRFDQMVTKDELRRTARQTVELTAAITGGYAAIIVTVLLALHFG